MREKRLERQKQTHPELGLADAKSVFAVDRLRRARGEEPTSLGRAVEDTIIEDMTRGPRDAYAQSDTSEDAAPRGEFFGGLNKSASSLQPEPKPDNPFLAMQAAQSEEVFARNRRVTADDINNGPQVLTNAAGKVLENLDRPRGALFGAAEGIAQGGLFSPSAGRSAFQGFMKPGEFQGGDLLTRAGVGDAALVGSLSARDITGGVADVLLDPVDLALGGALGVQALSRGVKKGAKAAVGALNAPGPLLQGEATQAAKIAPNLPLGRVVGKVDEAEAGTRVGNLLKPRGIEQLGESYQVKDALGVATDLQRQASSQYASLSADFDRSLRSLGKTFTDEAGNTYSRTIKAADGSPALLQDVLENPARYMLDPKQTEAVNRVAGLYDLVRNEREVFGVGPNEVGLEEGANFVSRLAKENSKGVELNASVGPRTGQRLGVGAERSRVFTDPLEAVQSGVVYDDPRNAFQRYAQSGLKRAADEHTKGLLVPFSETSAARVPAPLRAKHDALAQELTNLKGQAGRLDARLRNTVDAYLNSAEPDLDSLYDELNKIKVGPNARTTAGFNSTAVQGEIERVKEAVNELRPEWRAAIKQAQQTPAGRSRVSVDLAPALSGRDFTEKDAARIRRFYSNGILPDNTVGDALRGVKGVSNKLVPIQATGDASSLLRQMAVMAPSHPKTFARNAMVALRDSLMPGGWDEYQKWAGSDEVRYAASRGVALAGDSGATNDFYASWLDKVPGLRQAQRHFTSVGNRNRVEVFYQDLDLMRRSGQVVDAKAEEQVARNINRITGVANSRATDIESLAEFAPNWMRSKVETLSKALTDGTLEGDLARKYLSNYLLTGTVASGAIAISQGRDPMEVVSPFDIEALKRGEIRFNQNWLTVRAFGQDIGLGATFSDILRMGAVAADGAVGAIQEKDARVLIEALGSAARSKLSPALSLATDVAKGSNVVGDEIASWTYWLTKPLPITAGSAIRDAQQGVDPKDIAVGSAIEFFGGAASPLSPTERLNQVTPGGDFWNANPSVREQVKQDNPELWNRAVERGSESRQIAEAEKTRIREQQTASDAQLQSGQITIDQWKSERKIRRAELSGGLAQIYRDTPEREPDPNKPWEVYGAKIAELERKYNGLPDEAWNEIDAWRATLTDTQNAQIDAETGVTATPTEKQYRAVANELDDKQYFAIRDRVWEKIAARDPALANYGSVDEFRADIRTKVRNKLSERGIDPNSATANILTQDILEQIPQLKVWTDVSNQVEQGWIEANPELAARAYKWGYISSLRNDERAAIMGSELGSR